MAIGEWSDDDFGALPSVAVAAHELKSPLVLIRQLALLLNDVDEHEAHKLHSQIIAVSERSLGLVSDLSHTTNLTPALFPLEPVNPLAITQQIADESRAMAKLYNRRLSFPKSRQAKQLVVANLVLLIRIIKNFLDNALKYSEEAAEIKVTVKRVSDSVRFGVRDFGPMMSLAEYRRLIDEMNIRKTVKTRPESSGLGVYVASQFARAMHGSIGLIRHRDGLTFYVDMPISQQLSLL